MIALMGSIGCLGGEERPSGELPESASRAALIVERADGSSSATPLLPRGALAKVRFTTQPEDRIWLLGFSDDALSVLPLPSEEVLGHQALRTPLGCEPVLPAPTIARRLDEGATGAIAPSLTASWLADFCPGLDQGQSLWVDVNCGLRIVCPPSIHRDGCSLTLQFPACGPERVETRWRFDHQLCADASSLPPDCEIEGDQVGESVLLSCPRLECFIGLHRPKPPAFEVSLAPVAGVEAEAFVPEEDEPGGPEFVAGYLADLLLHRDQLIVASFDGRLDGTSCSTTALTRLHFFDAETLTEQRSISAPRCLSRLARDPRGSGFLGIFAEGLRFAIGRFAADGRMEQQAPLDFLLAGAGNPRAVELLVSDQEVLALLSRDEGAQVRHLTVLRLDPATLAPAAPAFAPAEPLSVFSATLTPGRSLIMNDNTGEGVAEILLDPSPGIRYVPAPFIGGQHVDAVVVHPSDGLVLGLGTRTPRAVHVFDRPRAPPGAAFTWVADGRFYESEAIPAAAAALRAEPDRVVIGLLRPQAGAQPAGALLAIYTYDRARVRASFEPGATPILSEGRPEPSPPTRLSIDAGGRVFGLLPWTGRIFRADPLPATRARSDR